jgi:aminopeptidase N
MAPMPGTNLTRDEARTRSALLQVDSYDIELDLTTGERTFRSSTTIRFRCAHPGAETFAELVGAEVHAVVLNGESLDPTQVYVDSRIMLVDLREHNELQVTADCRYSRTGEGLHRFVDPVDDRVYTYTQFEVPDARRVYTTFEQPDLKSNFTFTVTAPTGWTVISNAATPQPEEVAEGRSVWRFPQTERISTYITALVAGEYHSVHDTYRGKHGEIRLGHFCRRSIVDQMDVAELVEVTRQGFAFFEDAFDFPYPFGKYDQAYVPEYNMGAMENAGCVTFRDEYLPRSRQTYAFYEGRANTILHEMAHMWFGDLVTMRWWDDLWLNESFAEWAAHHASVKATKYTDAWTAFTSSRKNWAYRQDQLPSTHPVAADNHDLEAVEVNFDGITYAKGASILKQLVAWVGEDAFHRGLRQYFRKHAFGNTEFADLLTALEESSGRDLDSWAQEWLQTSGVNTLVAQLETDEEDRLTRFEVRQSATAEHPHLRRHRIGVGLYDLEDGSIVRRSSAETDIAGPATAVPALLGQRRPDLLLLNDGDLTYAKIRLDQRSLDTLVHHIADLDDSLARALCWGAAWDMTRDAEMSATEFVSLVLGGVARESDLTAVAALLRYAGQAVDQYSDPERRSELHGTFERGLLQLVESAEPGSDHQLALLRALAANARTAAGLDRVQGIYGDSAPLDGLEVSDDVRWTLLTALAAGGRAEEEQVETELQRDSTISGQERAAAARAVLPTAEAKQQAWEAVIERDDVPNETQRSIALAFQVPGQEELLEPFVTRYLDMAEKVWERKGSHGASVALQFLFPRALPTQQTLDRVDAWLARTEANPGAVRYVREGADDLRRALAAQRKDRQRRDEQG